MRTLNADQLKAVLSMESSLGHIHTLADVENTIDFLAKEEQEVTNGVEKFNIFDTMSYADLKDLYGWHISDLKIYNRPRPLSDFTRLRATKFGYEPVEIRHPPQSWFYVEDAECTS